MLEHVWQAEAAAAAAAAGCHMFLTHWPTLHSRMNQIQLTQKTDMAWARART
jgi:outer membrane autotransporter protein